MSARDDDSAHDRWARLRFSIIGSLLAAPPPQGELGAELARLSARHWRHPITGEPVKFAVSTIERWLYAARAQDRDPVGALKRRVRKDLGSQPSLGPTLRDVLRAQYREHPSWSYQLHADNLAARIAADPALGSMPSYSSVRRHMKAQGLERKGRRRSRETAGEERARVRLEEREVRSFESEHVGGLWHLDFHHGSLAVLTRAGEWVTPLLLGVLDDRSRLACHLQWYLEESAVNLVHGLAQAIQKRGLPRSLMTDNGGAMTAAETLAGLATLSIVHTPTLPHSPYQNAKQEVFWAQVEGRLLAMLEGVGDLTLALLNEATQAWGELEYNRKLHSELGSTPLSRYLAGPTVGRESPGSEELRRAFRLEARRSQRKSDGTLSIEGRRYEVPARLRHLDRLSVRYARWDLASVAVVDERTGVELATIYPLDKASNADGRRRRLTPVLGADADSADGSAGSGEVAPLLRRLMAEYAATGLPPAYLSQGDGELDDD